MHGTSSNIKVKLNPAVGVLSSVPGSGCPQFGRSLGSKLVLNAQGATVARSASYQLWKL